MKTEVATSYNGRVTEPIGV